MFLRFLTYVSSVLSLTGAAYCVYVEWEGILTPLNIAGRRKGRDGRHGAGLSRQGHRLEDD